MRLKAVKASSRSFILSVVWTNGTRSKVNLTDLVRNSRHFHIFAKNAAAFRRVRTTRYGTGIEWKNGLDCSVETLQTLSND